MVSISIKFDTNGLELSADDRCQLARIVDTALQDSGDLWVGCLRVSEGHDRIRHKIQREVVIRCHIWDIWALISLHTWGRILLPLYSQIGILGIPFPCLPDYPELGVIMSASLKTKKPLKDNVNPLGAIPSAPFHHRLLQKDQSI